MPVIHRRILQGLFTLAVLGLAGPVRAAEEAKDVIEPSGVEVSYLSRFFTTETMLGNVVIWLSLLISVAVVSLVLQAFLQHRPTVYIPPVLKEELERLLNEKNFREAMKLVAEDRSVFGQTMHAVLNQAARGYVAMEQTLFETAELVGSRRVRNLVWLEIAGAAGPMLGLFGTVFGMIVAFSKLVALGGAPKPAELAGGIATALVCTFWGLVVGIPGVIFAALFRVKIEGLISDVIVEGHHMIERFRPGGAAKKPAAPAAVPTAKAAE